MALPILLDCGPGHDDAITIILTPASPELDVKTVTSSAGSQTLEKALCSVLRILTSFNHAGIPVTDGVVKPLMCELVIADNVHGENGSDDPAPPEPTFAPQDCTTVELMAKTLRENAEPVAIVPTGPQTNVTSLLSSHPKLYGKIARIVIIGGATGLDNWTPAAGLNTYVDPEAVEVVFRPGIPVVMAGLNVIRKAQIRVEDTKRFRAISNPVSTIVTELLDFFLEYHKDEKWGFVGTPLHDPYTVAWLLKPKLSTSAGYWVGVEIRGKYTQGMMAADCYHLAGNRLNAIIMADADRQDFVGLPVDHLRFYA